MKQQNEAKRSFQLQYPDQRRVLVVKLGKYIYIYIYIFTSYFYPQSSWAFHVILVVEEVQVAFILSPLCFFHVIFLLEEVQLALILSPV